MMFTQDNAPSHAARFTLQSLLKLGIKNEKIMVWPPSSPDLNPIENFWSLLKRKIYANSRQYTSKDELWNAIVTSAGDIDPEDIRKLTKSIHDRFIEVISKNGAYVKK